MLPFEGPSHPNRPHIRTDMPPSYQYPPSATSDNCHCSAVQDITTTILLRPPAVETCVIQITSQSPLHQHLVPKTDNNDADNDCK